MTQHIVTAWEPPGPVSAAFMASRSQFQVICGPLGSGKTTAGLVKLIRLASMQAPSATQQERDGSGRLRPVRRFKACVVRDTYRQLWKTTIPSWFKRVPREAGAWSGADNAPATHRVIFQLGDGTLVDLQADFVAIGEQSAEQALDGYEPTAFLLDAANLLDAEVFQFAAGRTGRYPDMAEGGPTWHGVMMVCNAPQFSSWLYQDFIKLPREMLRQKRAEVFMQPGGFDPAAENLGNLPGGRDYYVNQALVNPKWYVDRLLKNLPGFDRAGRAVYDDFDDSRHVAPDILRFTDGFPLLIGIDGGGSPAAAFGQRLPRQWRILRELVTEQGTGPRRFGEMVARFLHEQFPGVKTIRAFADPSAWYGGDRQREGETWIDIFRAASGLQVRPAPSNAPSARWESVRSPLTRMSGDGPGFLLSPDCFVLREGFSSGYRFRKVVGKTDQYHDEAEKNRYSHVHDALQYMTLGAGEHLEVLGRAQQAEAATQHRQAADWDPFGVAGAA